MASLRYGAHKTIVSWLRFGAIACHEDDLRRIDPTSKVLYPEVGKTLSRDRASSHVPRPFCSLLPPYPMKCPPKTQRPPNMDADGTSSSRSNGLGGTAQEKARLTTTDLREHLETLQVVSSIASKVFSLLGEQMESISSTIPLQRGQETVC